MKESDLVSAWPASTLEKRLRDCLLMLRLQCAVTDRENSAIKKRITAIISHLNAANAETSS